MSFQVETKEAVLKTTLIVCLFGLMGISGFTSALAQETDNREQTVTGHTIVEDWSGSEDLYLVSFSTSQSVPGGEFLAFVSKDILDETVTVVNLFWHDDDLSGEDARDRVLAQARLVVQEDGYLVAPYRPHGSSYSHRRMKDEFDLQRALVDYLSSIGVDKFNFYGDGGGSQIALILAGELPDLVRTIGLSSPYELCPYDYDHSPIERIKELPDVPILIVHDRPDESARLRDTYAYVLDAEREGRQVRLVVEGATVDDSPHYGTMALLGRELHKHLPIHKSDRIVSDGSIDDKVLDQLQEALDLSRDYARKRLGITPPGADVFIGNDPEWLTDRNMEAFKLEEGVRTSVRRFFDSCSSPATAGFTAIFVPGCSWLLESEAARELSVHHEWWHANVQYHHLQTFCCGGNRMQIVGPHWLVEGSANVWSLLVEGDFTNNLERMKSRYRERLPADFDLLALNSRERFRYAPSGKGAAIDLAAVMLLEMAGLNSLEEFYRRLGRYINDEAARELLDLTASRSLQLIEFRDQFFDPPHRYQRLDEIFNDSFGQTMEQFADSFSAYLSQEEVSSGQQAASSNQQGVSHSKATLFPSSVTQKGQSRSSPRKIVRTGRSF